MILDTQRQHKPTKDQVSGGEMKEEQKLKDVGAMKRQNWRLTGSKEQPDVSRW